MTRLIDRNMPSCIFANGAGAAQVITARAMQLGSSFTVGGWWRNEGRFHAGNTLMSSTGGAGILFGIAANDQLQSYDDGFPGSFLTAQSGVALFGWEWLGCTYDGTTIRHYRNGRLTASGAVAGRNLGPITYRWLRSTTAVAFASSAHLIVALRPLTAAEIQDIYSIGPAAYPPDLVLDWRGDEGAGTTVRDYSTAGNNGTVSGSLVFSPRSPM